MSAQSAQSAQFFVPVAAGPSAPTLPAGYHLCPFEAARGGQGKPHFVRDIDGTYCKEHKKRMDARRTAELLKQQEQQERDRLEILRMRRFEAELLAERERRNKFLDEEEARQNALNEKSKKSERNYGSSSPSTGPSLRKRSSKPQYYEPEPESESEQSESESYSEEYIPPPPPPRKSSREHKSTPKSQPVPRSEPASSVSSSSVAFTPRSSFAPSNIRAAAAAAAESRRSVPPAPPVAPPVIPSSTVYQFPGLTDAGLANFTQFFNSNTGAMDQLTQFFNGLSLNAKQPRALAPSEAYMSD